MSYTPTNWVTGDIVTAEKLNHIEQGINDKQDTLVSGTSIKTINNESLLGPGNVNAASASELMKSMFAGQAIFFRYDFLDCTVSGSTYTPNFDTSKLTGGWSTSKLSADGFAPTVGYANRVGINKYCQIDYISYRAKVYMPTLDACFVLGSVASSSHASVISFNFSTKKVLIGNKGNGSSIPSTNYTLDMSSIVTTTCPYYWIEIGRANRHVYAKVTNYYTSQSVEHSIDNDASGTSLNYPAGWLYDTLTFAQSSGTQGYFQEVSAFIPYGLKLCIIGDSITQGYGNPVDQCWATMLAHEIGNSVNMGRSGATIAHSLRQVDDLCSIIKPQYIMVTIGTNADPSVSDLNSLKTKIEATGAIPIINAIYRDNGSRGTAARNAKILALHTLCVRMDIATSTDFDLSKSQNTSLFLGDVLHLNQLGNEYCFTRAMQDVGHMIKGRY